MLRDYAVSSIYALQKLNHRFCYLTRFESSFSYLNAVIRRSTLQETDFRL